MYVFLILPFQLLSNYTFYNGAEIENFIHQFIRRLALFAEIMAPDALLFVCGMAQSGFNFLYLFHSSPF